MAAVTLLASVFTTTAGNKSIAGTPAVGDLILLVTAHTGYTGTTAPTDNNADGLGAYTNVTNCLKATSADKMDLWVRNALVGSATSTTFSHNVAVGTGGGILVLKATGMIRSGSAAIRGSGNQANQATTTTPAPVLSATPLTGNPTISAVFNATNPAGTTIPASFTDRANLGYATPTTGIRGVSRDSGQTTATITWGGTSASAFCSLAAELDTSDYQSLVIDLMQGSTVIATWTETPTTAWATVVRSLSAAQADSITDHTALRVRLTATGGGGTRSRVSWAQLDVPYSPLPATAQRRIIRVQR